MHLQIAFYAKNVLKSLTNSYLIYKVCNSPDTNLILVIEILERDLVRQIGMQESTERQSIVPTAAEVSDVDTLEQNIQRNETTNSCLQVA